MRNVFILLFLITITTYSQVEKRIDSLEKIYNSKNLETKLKTADKLFELYIYHKPEVVKKELSKLKALCEKQNNKKGIIITYTHYMSLYTVQAQFDSTLYYGNKALELLKKTNEWKALYKSYFGLGNIFFYQNKFAEAIKFY